MAQSLRQLADRTDLKYFSGIRKICLVANVLHNWYLGKGFQSTTSRMRKASDCLVQLANKIQQVKIEKPISYQKENPPEDRPKKGGNQLGQGVFGEVHAIKIILN